MQYRHATFARPELVACYFLAMVEGEKIPLPFPKALTGTGGGSSRRTLAHLLAPTAYLFVAGRTTGLGPLPIVVAATMVIAVVPDIRRSQSASVALPFILFVAFYHWLGWLGPSITTRGVHVFSAYWFDKTLFGVGPIDDRLSLNEVFAAWHGPLLDFVTGLVYLSFLPFVFAFAAYLIFTNRRTADARVPRRFAWTFLAVNVAGYATYVLCPVAPPWYVAAYGFGPVNPATRASAAALSRWDTLTGIPYFERFYSQATEVFGALPSMHCAYPMLLVLFAWELRRRRLTGVLVVYQLLMCFSAVYLQHHYVTDVVAGMVYAAAGYFLGRVVDHATSPPSAH